MKLPNLHFFTIRDNTPLAAKPVRQKSLLTGSISRAGQLLLPADMFDGLLIDPLTIGFKIGCRAGRRPLDALYLVPALREEADVFALTKSAKGYTISIAPILAHRAMKAQTDKYVFTITPFAFEGGLTGYELVLNVPLPKLQGINQPGKSALLMPNN